tara:strand:- start:11914 stop:13914 length:2001 start_codon:yes stop_codon:yes gene_type:complete
MSSKNITGVANTGSVFITGSLELNELKVPTIFNKRIEQNKIELYNEDVVLSSKSDYTINYNDGNLGTTPIFNIKKNGTEKFIINDSGADVKSGEIFYNGTALKNVTETLQNKSIDGNNNTITNIPNSSLPSNVAVTDSNNNFSVGQTFSGVASDSVVGKTNSNHALIFTNGLDAALESPDGVLLRYNAGGATTNTLRIRDHITNKAEFNNNGLNILDSGEVFYGGTALKNFTETLANKTLTAPVIATIQPIVGATITIPNATDTLVGKATTDVLTNKTITDNIAASLKPSANNTITFPDESDEVVLRTSSQILTNKTLNSAVMTSFRLSSNGPNISIPVPVGNDNMVLRNHTETLTNKTLTSPVLTTPVIASLQPSSGGGNTITFPDESDEVVLRTATQTLTNKSLLQPSITQPSMSQLKPNGSTTISFPTTGGADTCVYEDHTQTLTNKTIAASNNTLQIASTDLTDAGSFIAASSNNTFTGNNTFNNVITGDITGNPLNSSFRGFFGRLSGGINRPVNNANKFTIGSWRIDPDTGSTGRRDTWVDGIATSSGTTVSSIFSLPSGYYQISAMCRIIDYEPSNGELILFFSTNGNFSGNVNASYPQSFSTRRVLQDQSITMNLNCCIKLQNTSTCCLMMQPTVADSSGGFSVNERSWLSVVKIRDI